MKNRKTIVSLLFSLLFAAGAYAQEVDPAPTVDEYNTWKTLATLALMILALAWFYHRSRSKSAGKADQSVVESEDGDPSAIPGEVAAAILMMMNDMDEEVHDKDNTILTLREVKRNYSPWNFKLFGMRQMPQRKITR